MTELQIKGVTSSRHQVKSPHPTFENFYAGDHCHSLLIVANQFILFICIDNIREEYEQIVTLRDENTVVTTGCTF